MAPFARNAWMVTRRIHIDDGPRVLHRIHHRGDLEAMQYARRAAARLRARGLCAAGLV